MTHPRRCRALFAVIAFAAVTTHAEDPGLARGAELLAPFKKDLKQALKSGLADGPAAAIQVCRVKAPGIADALSVEGVRMGRSSHKLRNPDNAAPDWVSPVMQAYLDEPASREPRIVELPGARWGYVEPIAVQPLCLTCHGSTLAPDVAAQISDLYPDDRAVNFEVGDLRGVFWLEFPADTP
ncbi:MAG TPA: DUF3365 domain-containing protein [Woeseiaceae bacterium]|nr:DUF3365 domain-containing protein [Woeseiaceae bacterium]